MRYVFKSAKQSALTLAFFGLFQSTPEFSHERHSHNENIFIQKWIINHISIHWTAYRPDASSHFHNETLQARAESRRQHLKNSIFSGEVKRFFGKNRNKRQFHILSTAQHSAYLSHQPEKKDKHEEYEETTATTTAAPIVAA